MRELPVRWQLNWGGTNLHRIRNTALCFFNERHTPTRFDSGSHVAHTAQTLPKTDAVGGLPGVNARVDPTNAIRHFACCASSGIALGKHRGI